MEEKGLARGQQGKQRTIVPSSKKAVRIQDGCREWVTNIEGVSADGFLLPLFVIFKGKLQQKIWKATLDQLGEPKGVCAISNNGWTDNVLGAK